MPAVASALPPSREQPDRWLRKLLLRQMILRFFTAQELQSCYQDQNKISTRTQERAVVELRPISVGTDTVFIGVSSNSIAGPVTIAAVFKPEDLCLDGRHEFGMAFARNLNLFG